MPASIRPMSRSTEMLFSRRMLMVITPVGVAIGLYEAWRLAGGLVLLMALQISVLAVVLVGLVREVRRQSAQGGRKS
jgi:hypothetical protein